jgi:hypothetical protein
VIDEAEVESILDEIDQLVLSLMPGKEEPQCILSGSGYGWFWSPQTKQMTRVRRGTEIVFLSEYDSEKILVMSHSNILAVNKNEIIEVGFN